MSFSANIASLLNRGSPSAMAAFRSATKRARSSAFVLASDEFSLFDGETLAHFDESAND
jgi:hypothetical protein